MFGMNVLHDALLWACSGFVSRRSCQTSGLAGRPADDTIIPFVCQTKFKQLSTILYI
jgi:hypothetical protein